MDDLKSALKEIGLWALWWGLGLHNPWISEIIKWKSQTIYVVFKLIKLTLIPAQNIYTCQTLHTMNDFFLCIYKPIIIETIVLLSANGAVKVFTLFTF